MSMYNYSEFVFHDTLAASKKHFQGNLENHQLQTVAAACGYDLTKCVKYGNENAEQQYDSYSTMMMYEIADEIEDAPTVDAVEVVRCRECKQGEVDDPDFPDQYYCHAGCGWNNGDFYCAYGEREEGADNG